MAVFFLSFVGRLIDEIEVGIRVEVESRARIYCGGGNSDWTLCDDSGYLRTLRVMV